MALERKRIVRRMRRLHLAGELDKLVELSTEYQKVVNLAKAMVCLLEQYKAFDEKYGTSLYKGK